MDDFLQNFSAIGALALVVPFVGLLILYLVIRLAVMHALRDHERWMENRRGKAAHLAHQNEQRYSSITPESHEPF